MTAGVWSLDTGTANLPFRIEAVLNAQGIPVGAPSSLDTVGTAVVFRRVA